MSRVEGRVSREECRVTGGKSSVPFFSTRHPTIVPVVMICYLISSSGRRLLNADSNTK